MPLDPSIIMQAGQGVTPIASPIDQAAKAMTLKHMMDQSELLPLQKQQAQQGIEMNQMNMDKAKIEMAKDHAVTQALSGADLSTPDGQLKAVTDVMKVDPTRGMKLMNDLGKAREQESTIKKNISTADKNSQELAYQHTEAVDSALGNIGLEMKKLQTASPNMTFSQMAQNPDLLAKYAAERQRLLGMKKADGTPMFKPEEIPEQFDPQHVMVAAQHSKKMLDALKPQSAEGKIVGDVATGNLTEAQGKKALEKKDRISVNVNGGNVQPSGDYSKTGEDYLRTIPIAERALVKGIAENRINPNSLSTRGGHREKILAQVAQYTGDKYEQQEFGNISAAEKGFNTGKQGQSVRAFNVALEHLDTLGELSTALNNKDTKVLNQVANTWKTQTGSSAPTNFNAAKQLVADEVVKAIVGSGGGVSDREEAAKTINAASSPEQLAGTIETYKKLFGGQIKGLEQQYKSSTGKDNFREKYLTDRGREAAKHETPFKPTSTAKTQGGATVSNW